MTRDEPPLRVELDDGAAVLLRAPKMSDAHSLVQNADHREVWINLRDHMPNPYSLDDAVRWLRTVESQSPRLSFVIDLDGQAIGGIGLVPGTDIERCSAEVGYWIGPGYWGRGIATGALRRICDYAFRDLGFLRLFAVPIAWNAASFRVLEKAGFQREGLMRNACVKDNRVVDMALYAKIPT